MYPSGDYSQQVMRGNEHLWWSFSAKIVNDFHPLKLILRKKT